MKALHSPRRRAASAGILITCSLLCCIIGIAATQDKETSVSEGLFDQGIYTSLKSDEKAGIHELADDFELRQFLWVPVLVPEPDFVNVLNAGAVVFTSAPDILTQSFLRRLVPQQSGTTVTYPVTVHEDRITRECVFLNARGEEIAAIPCPDDYDPAWHALERYPDLLQKTQAEIDHHLAVFDPARVVVKYDIILEQDLVRYVIDRSLQAIVPELGGGMMMSMGWNGGSVSNIEFKAIDSTNGIQMTVVYPDDYTNRLDIYTCSDLIEFWWKLAVTTNIDSSTNWIAWKDISATNNGPAIRFYAAGNADLDSDEDGTSDAREHYLYHSDPSNDASFPVDVSGTASYSGYQSGPIRVLAVTNTEIWGLGRATVLSSPGSYTNTGIPTLHDYWFKAWRDSNTNNTPDQWEATGLYTNAATYLTNNLSGIDIALSDPAANVNGTIHYSGGQSGSIYVIAVTTSNNWSTNNSDVLSEPGTYHIPGLSPTNYWLKAFKDADADGLNDGTNQWGSEACGTYEYNPLTVSTGHHGADITLLDPDNDGDGMPDWWETLHGLDPQDNTDGYTVIGETGAITTNQTSSNQWHLLSFRNSYSNPVVVITPLSSGDTSPAVIRARNVTVTNAEYQIDEWDYLDGTHGTETVSYVVLDIGVHTLIDGTRVQAGTAQRNNNWGEVTFQEAFDEEPTVLSQVQTVNDSAAIVTRQKLVTNTSFRVQVQEEEGNDGTHAQETVGYIAWERTGGSSAGVVYETGVTGDEVTENWHTLPFATNFTSPVFLSAMQTRDGGDTAGLRYQYLTASNVHVKVAEEASADGELGHTSESVGYLVIEGTTNICGDPPDLDADGLSNLHEYQYGTDPQNTDSDGDGVADGDEVDNGTDPTDPDDPPSISGEVFYDGRQTGTIWVVAVTSSNSWSTTYSDALSGPGAYIVPNLPEDDYWIKAFRDSNGNGTNDATEAWGGDPEDPCTIGENLVGAVERVTGIDVMLGDPDEDTDSLPDWWEIYWFGAMTNQTGTNDWDTDGLVNTGEYAWSTCPTNSDTDADGMPDGWEATNGTAPLTYDAWDDEDWDGLNNLQEYQNNTDPWDADTDDDGLGDGAEVDTYGTDPTDSDSDDDGLSDGDEVTVYGTDPTEEDTDQDGFSDYEEIFVFRSDPNLAGDLPEQYPDESQTVYYGHPSPSATNFVYSYSISLYDKVTMGKGWITNALFVPDLSEVSDTVYYGQPDHTVCSNFFVHSRTSTMWNDVRMGEGWITHGGFITDYTQATTTVYYGKPDESGHNDLFVYGTHPIDMDDEVEMGKGWVTAGGFVPDPDESSDQIWYTRPDNINNPTNWVYTYDFRAGGWYDIGDGWLRANSPPTYIPDLAESSAIVYYGLPGPTGTSDRFVCSYSIDMRDDVILAKGWATPHGVLADLDSTAWPIYYGNIDGHPDRFVFSRTTIGMSNWTYIGQGWVNMQDYVLNSEASPDENGDGWMDGYDPFSSEDPQPPDDSHATELVLTVGDISGSHSEMYALHVSNCVLRMSSVSTQLFLFSETYTVLRGSYFEDAYLESLYDEDADGDYYAAVSGEGIYVDDYDGVLGETNNSGFNSGNRYFDVYVPKVDILAHRPGTRFSPGDEVSKVHENMSGGIVACVNSDNDDGGPSGDHDYDNTYVGSSDDDIITLTLKEILPDELDEGTLVLTVEPTNTAVRIFRSAVSVLDDYELDLSSPGGNDLGGILSGDVDLYVEILEWYSEITIKLAYKDPDGAEVCADQVLLSVLDTSMKRPENQYSGDAITNGTVFHSYFKGGSPGVCGVECSLVALPGTSEMRSFLNGKIGWTIDSVQDSELSWQNGTTGVYNSVFGLWYEKAQFTGLPMSNSAFGEKTATYTIAELEWQGQGTAKVFFDADSKNHPGEGSGTTPNWYYYWRQTEAGEGYTNSYGGQHPKYAGEMKYSDTEKKWVCIIYDGATGMATRHNVRTGSNYTYQSINSFAYTVRHEETHRLQFIDMWGDGGGSSTSPENAAYDTDGDGLRDSVETNMIPTRPYDVTGPPDYPPTYDDDWNYGDGFDDAEDACMWEQSWPDQNVYDASDWANPGRQYGAGYSQP